MGPVRATAAHRDMAHAGGAGHRRHPGAPVGSDSARSGDPHRHRRSRGSSQSVKVGPLQDDRPAGRPRMPGRWGVPALAGILAITILIGLQALTVCSRRSTAVAPPPMGPATADLPVHHVIAIRDRGSLAEFIDPATADARATTCQPARRWSGPGRCPTDPGSCARTRTGQIHDFGLAAVGLIVLSVMLAHGVALAAERGAAGVLCWWPPSASAARDPTSGAFIVGKRFGERPASTLALAEQDTRRPRRQHPRCRGRDRLIAPALWSVGGRSCSPAL